MILAVVNSATERLGYVEESLKRYVISFSCVEASHLQELGSQTLIASRYSGMVILGNFQSIYEEDRYPFIAYEKKVVEEFIESNKPVIGISFGAQIVASVLGARVYRGDRGAEIGWYELQITGDGAKDAVFSKYYPRIMALQWHGDTFDLPKDAVRIITSSKYLNQGFRYRKNVYGLQFHLEAKKEDVSEWCRVAQISEEETQKILSGFDMYSSEMRKISDDLVWWLFVNSVW
ncbi:MAG: type 1 glutamine amidotransferase [Brevinematia bacterium]